ncbi:hypothetical protein ABBQ38_003340 [Trebouxia sp. C0009 RCD-2024]
MAADHGYEFMGPVFGPMVIMMALPAVCYGLVYFCNSEGCFSLGDMTLPGLPPQARLISAEAFVAILGWLAFQSILHCILPGQNVQGTLLPNGKRLTYKFNAKLNLAVTLIAAATFSFYLHVLPLSWIYDNFLPLLTAASTITILLVIGLYTSSFSHSKMLALGGNTDSGIYNFFIGRELNPRIGTFDLKHFCELYPGLIGWLVIDLGMLQKQYEKHGSVSTSMTLVCIFQFVYVLDALWFETAILSTMDIVHDGFGFMLAFGDLVWVPFTYSLQARYLVDHPQALPNLALLAILCLKGLGYCAFRGANSQKDTFRRDPTHPSVRNLQTLKTERGTRLITSGWWGVARHINYTGDWLMAWAWCLPCSFGSIIPYFYVIYFAALLVHREMRDEHACSRKYGADWDKYKAMVRYRLIPFVY